MGASGPAADEKRAPGSERIRSLSENATVDSRRDLRFVRRSRYKSYTRRPGSVGTGRANALGMLDKSDELRDRVEARKHELLAKYNELKADSKRDAAQARDKVKAKLDELELHLKNGWTKVSDDVRTKLNKWLDRHDD